MCTTTSHWLRTRGFENTECSRAAADLGLVTRTSGFAAGAGHGLALDEGVTAEALTAVLGTCHGVFHLRAVCSAAR